MMIRNISAYLFAIALMSAPAAVKAQDCSTLIAQRASLQARMGELVANYPGTHVVIGMCAAGASNTYNQTGDAGQATQAFAVCAGIGCALVGFQNCSDVAGRWFSMAIEDSQISDKLKRC